MLKRATVNLNKRIVEAGLVKLTWGNGSIIDRETSTVYIKPSGVDVGDLADDQVSVVDISGSHLFGLKPSVDTDIHLELYRAHDSIGSVVHTHSKYCTIFAQMKRCIPALGTTHADHFYGDIPVVHELLESQITKDYERNTGKSVVEFLKASNINPMNIPAALLPLHGVLTWGETSTKALENAIAAEICAEMAYKQLLFDRTEMRQYPSIDKNLLDKHFLRKHGKGRYYGQ